MKIAVIHPSNGRPGIELQEPETITIKHLGNMKLFTTWELMM